MAILPENATYCFDTWQTLARDKHLCYLFLWLSFSQKGKYFSASINCFSRNIILSVSKTFA